MAKLANWTVPFRIRPFFAYAMWSGHGRKRRREREKARVEKRMPLWHSVVIVSKECVYFYIYHQTGARCRQEAKVCCQYLNDMLRGLIYSYSHGKGSILMKECVCITVVFLLFDFSPNCSPPSPSSFLPPPSRTWSLHLCIPSFLRIVQVPSAEEKKPKYQSFGHRVTQSLYSFRTFFGGQHYLSLSRLTRPLIITSFPLNPSCINTPWLAST